MAISPHTDSLEARVLRLKTDIWIRYTRASEIRDRLEALLVHPKTHRMPNLAIISETNNGKSMLLNNFYELHPPSQDPASEYTILPVLLVQMPPEPDEGRLYSAMLERLFIEGPPKEPAASKLKRLKEMLTKLQTRMILFDEFSNLLAGSYLKQRKALNGIKYLGNELRIPIVAAGTIETRTALASDPQLANRFTPVTLPRWQDDEEFARLMLSLEPKLGLQHASNLHEEHMTAPLVAASEGLIGEVVTLLRLLAEHAMRSGIEKITEPMLSRDFLRKTGWTRPSERMLIPV